MLAVVFDNILNCTYFLRIISTKRNKAWANEVNIKKDQTNDVIGSIIHYRV